MSCGTEAGKTATRLATVARGDSGPLRFRLVLQPVVAAYFAIRSGLRDAREGRPPYVWSLLVHATRRGELLRELWRDVGRVLLAAVAVDLVYQAVVLGAFRPGEAVIVAAVLAIVPYVLFRGPVNRALPRAVRGGGR